MSSQLPALPQVSDPKRKKKALNTKQASLPDEAVDILNEWFDDHVNNPYPCLEEKERLAQAGGISLKQVNAWFSNRRNRSQNTRPKRIKRQFEKEIASIMNELVQPNSDTNYSNPYTLNVNVIEKLQKTLQSTSNKL